MKNTAKSLLIAAALATVASVGFAKTATAPAPAGETAAPAAAATAAPTHVAAKATHAKKHRKGASHKKAA